LWPGLKTGVENGIFWSEIGSGFGGAGGIQAIFRKIEQDNCFIIKQFFKIVSFVINFFF